MNAISGILPYIQIGISALLVGAVLLQRSESSLGGAFGAGDNWGSSFHTRRGIEKIIFFATIALGILFAVVSIMVLLLV